MYQIRGEHEIIYWAVSTGENLKKKQVRWDVPTQVGNLPAQAGNTL